jgi:hypothetical protein
VDLGEGVLPLAVDILVAILVLLQSLPPKSISSLPEQLLMLSLNQPKGGSYHDLEPLTDYPNQRREITPVMAPRDRQEEK